MTYEFQNDETGETIELDYHPDDEKPSEITRNGKTYRRVFATAFKIPYEFTQDTMDFSKRPREKRKYK